MVRKRSTWFKGKLSPMEGNSRRLERLQKVNSFPLWTVSNKMSYLLKNVFNHIYVSCLCANTSVCGATVRTKDNLRDSDPSLHHVRLGDWGGRLGGKHFHQWGAVWWDSITVLEPYNQKGRDRHCWWQQDDAGTWLRDKPLPWSPVLVRGTGPTV